MRGRPPVLPALLLTLTCTLGGPAVAYPVLVRASSRIELAMRHEGTRMAIDGRVTRDDGAPVPGASVSFAVGMSMPLVLQTGEDGRFGWAGDVAFGQVDVVATFAGTDTIEATTERRRFEFGKDDVALDLALPARIDRARGQVELEVRARSGVGNSGIAVTLLSAGGRAIASGSTDATGLVRLRVEPRALGGAGPVRLEARSTADALRGEGHAFAETVLVSRPRLRVSPLPASIAADGELAITGVLTDEERPIARGAVEIRVDRAPALRTATNARGAFGAVVAVEPLPTGSLDVRVRYEPDAAWHLPVEVGPIRVDHLAPTPLAWWLLLVPFGVTAVALLVVLRVSRARGIGARRGQRSRQAPARLAGGLQPSRPSESRMRASRRPPDPEIAGRVWDPTTKRAIGGALVEVGVAGTATTLTCDAGGRFATGPLPAGDVSIEASATGYLSEAFTARVPHQGELRDFRIDLVPVRHRVMEIYRDAALQVLPERELWGFWTPRELLRFARKRKEAREMPLQPLTELFEEVYYAGRGATALHVQRAIDLAASVGVRAPQ